MRTPQNSSNKYINFRLAYIYRDYLKKMMTAVIWCCVFNLWVMSGICI